MTTDKYPKFGSISRRYRPITVTEKIDGTNGLIHIQRCEDDDEKLGLCLGNGFHIHAGSRNRWLDLDDDNHGFARWVIENAHALVTDLGEGHHYGEWWGSGINRGYGLTKGEKRFSLFNVGRWTNEDERLGLQYPVFSTPNLGVVPVLEWEKPNSDALIQNVLADLKARGSFAADGFMNPEGIVIWHTQGRFYEKVTLENDGIPKSLAK